MSVHHQIINRPPPIIHHHAYCPSNSVCPNSNHSKPYPSLVYSECDQLRIKIHEVHLSYLSQDEAYHSSKLALKDKIENLITEYLSLIPHDQKFSFSEIKDCLNKTVKRPDFDPKKVISAFEAIDQYAINLLVSPWRPEWKSIHSFCGYFRRTIDSILVNYEKIFELLGFAYDKSTNIYKLIEIPIDPDKVSEISLECLVAIVECKIMANIYNLVKSKFPDISWTDV